MPRYLRGAAGASNRTLSSARRGASAASFSRPSRPISASAAAGSLGRAVVERSMTSSPSTIPSPAEPAPVTNRQTFIARDFPTKPAEVAFLRPWGEKRRSQRWSVVELADQLDHAALDLVAGGADLLDRAALRVLQLPVEVALAGDVGTLVAAAHCHHHVGPLGVGRRQLARRPGRQLDSQLAHRLDHLGMNPLARFGPGGARLVVAGGGAFEERLAHLRAPGVVQAD